MTKRKQIIRNILLLFVLMALSSFSPPLSNDTTVFICMKGEVYHSVKSCRGLKNVKSKIISVKKSEAEIKNKRRPCKICC